MTGNTDMQLLVTDALNIIGPQYLVMVFLCIQIAIDKMQLCRQTACPRAAIHVVYGCEGSWMYCQIL